MKGRRKMDKIRKYTSSRKKLENVIDPVMYQDIMKLQNRVYHCAQLLSAGWNTENYKKYDEACRIYFKYIVTLEDLYDIIIVLSDEKLHNERAGRYCYTYRINYAKKA